MQLRVVSCCTYLTGAEGIVWRPRDYDAHDFVMAVKGRSIDGFAQVPCRGQIHRIENDTRDLALGLFGQMIADVTPLFADASRPIVLVPVPNSACDTGSSRTPRTCAQADALAHELGRGASVCDALRWTEPLRSARSSGGSRDPLALLEKLTTIAALPPRGSQIVLVDDLLASGGHLLACAAIIAREGSECFLGVVAGRSDRTPADDPFRIRVDVLADFV